LAAFFYLIYGGFMYLTSSGNAESVKKAGSTLLNAAIGLAIAISATTLVNFFASRLTQ
jgi:biopolymer transport protein ExbB/TolQ